jgi:hypothetical protein
VRLNRNEITREENSGDREHRISLLLRLLGTGNNGQMRLSFN